MIFRFTSKILLLLVLMMVTPIRSQDKMAATHQFIKEIYDRKETKLNGFLLQEMALFLQTYPTSAQSDEIRFLKGNVHLREKDNYAAFTCYLKGFCLNSPGASRDSCQHYLSKFASDQNFSLPRHDTLWTILKSPIEAHVAIGERFFALLTWLVRLDEKELYPFTTPEAHDFLQRFPDSPHAEQLYVWLAELYQKEAQARKTNIFKSSRGNYLAADAFYTKVARLYPQSQFLPYTEYQRGLIHRDLDAPLKAIDILKAVAGQYPENEYAVKSLFEMAQIREREIKNPDQALQDYAQVVTRYPASEEAVASMLAMAETKRKNKTYPEAIAVYQQLLTQYPAHPAGKIALDKMAEIYQKNLKDWESAAQTRFRFQELYPGDPQTAGQLLEAGEIYEKKVKNPEKAARCYQTICKYYFNQPVAKEAAARLPGLPQVEIDAPDQTEVPDSTTTAPESKPNAPGAPSDSNQAPTPDNTAGLNSTGLAHPPPARSVKPPVLKPPGTTAAVNQAALANAPQADPPAPMAEFLSDLEQEVVAEINRLRTNPAEYADQYVAPFKIHFQGNLITEPGKVSIITHEGVAAVEECYQVLKKTAAMRALLPARGLSRAAKDHVTGQGPTGDTGHDGVDGSRMSERIARYGNWGGGCAENISYGHNDARRIVLQLIIDDGVASRGHRKNLLNASYRFVGVACGAHARYGYMCVQDFSVEYEDLGN
ncbi:tetratricopeptide repeat protein [candidate division KSB1 bacterium]|nr:tetratricopeptide repeat protein [candidate division KSB1 bacterium]